MLFQMFGSESYGTEQRKLLLFSNERGEKKYRRGPGSEYPGRRYFGRLLYYGTWV